MTQGVLNATADHWSMKLYSQNILNKLETLSKIMSVLSKLKDMSWARTFHRNETLLKKGIFFYRRRKTAIFQKSDINLSKLKEGSWEKICSQKWNLKKKLNFLHKEKNNDFKKSENKSFRNIFQLN